MSQVSYRLCLGWFIKIDLANEVHPGYIGAEAYTPPPVLLPQTFETYVDKSMSSSTLSGSRIKSEDFNPLVRY